MELPSGNGYQRVGFRLGRRSDATTVLADIRLSSCFPYLGPAASRVTLHRVPIVGARLGAMADSLGAWLDRPEPFAVDLVEDRWDTFHMAVADDTTAGLQKPACEVTYRWAGMGGTFDLSLDESCIRVFHNDIVACPRLWGSL